ncbi:hypothetical protein SNE40_014133 [Patella caerulea]|uniref:Uncharacterized protein n=1 Tax=Patella caerulea TaxID=87958 RepID=A0AAN8PS80_PATCE
MKTISINKKGVLKLLQGLKEHKASGPDDIPPRILKAAATELAPVLTQQSTWIQEEKVLRDTAPRHHPGDSQQDGQGQPSRRHPSMASAVQPNNGSSQWSRWLPSEDM